MVEDPGNRDAPAGYVYVCMACGKMSKDIFGYKRISKGWDESCMMNSMLVNEKLLELSEDGGQVVALRSENKDGS